MSAACRNTSMWGAGHSSGCDLLLQSLHNLQLTVFSPGLVGIKLIPCTVFKEGESQLEAHGNGSKVQNECY